MANRLGVKLDPVVLEHLFRVGAVIRGSHGFATRLAENGIPDTHEVEDFGFYPKTGEFFMVFREKGHKGAGPVQWQVPVYEKE